MDWQELAAETWFESLEWNIDQRLSWNLGHQVESVHTWIPTPSPILAEVFLPSRQADGYLGRTDLEEKACECLHWASLSPVQGSSAVKESKSLSFSFSPKPQGLGPSRHFSLFALTWGSSICLLVAGT